MKNHITNDDHPLISIIIPVFNRKQLVLEAVQSALDQTFRHVEVVVVDDASDDGTYEVLKTIESSIVLLRHKKNKGQAAARNTGINACSGKYVLFLDSDDRLEPDAIETLWSLFQPLEKKNKLWGVCYGKRLTCDSALSPVKTKPKKYYSGFILPYLLKENIVRTGTYIVRKSILEETGGFKEDLVVKEDLLLLFYIAVRYKFLFADRFISKFRRHSGPRARDNYLKILEQGTKHLDYFLNAHPDTFSHSDRIISRSYSEEHLKLAKIAWRLSLNKQYLHHWKKMCFLKKMYLVNPKYMLRALISAVKS